jgi:hypothetical protein
MIPVRCSGCGKPFEVDVALEGKTAVCPHCQAAVAVPKGASQAASGVYHLEVPEKPAEPEPVAEPVKPKPKQPGKKVRKTTSHTQREAANMAKSLAKGAGVVLVVVVVGAAVIFGIFFGACFVCRGR